MTTCIVSFCSLLLLDFVTEVTVTEVTIVHHFRRRSATNCHIFVHRHYFLAALSQVHIHI